MVDVTLYSPNSIENTMATGVMDSGWKSRSALAARYATLDVKHAIAEICYFLNRRIPDDGDQLNKYRVAARAMYPNYGAIGLNRCDDYATVAYYWRAAHDETVRESSVEERVDAFVTALYECQRKILVSELRTSDDEVADDMVCRTGVYDKFAETFSTKHPDVTSVDIFFKVLELIRGFAADNLFTHGVSYELLVNPNFEIMLDQSVKDNIKKKVKKILGNRMDARLEGYLNDTLNYIGSLEFTKPDSTYAVRHVYRKQEVLDLIKFAKTEYARSLLIPVTAAATAPESLSNEQVAEIKSIVIGILPLPTVVAFDHTRIAHTAEANPNIVVETEEEDISALLRASGLEGPPLLTPLRPATTNQVSTPSTISRPPLVTSYYNFTESAPCGYTIPTTPQPMLTVAQQDAHRNVRLTRRGV